MATSRLTQRHVNILKPGRKTRDRELKGFGIQILPSGRTRYLPHSQVDGQRVWHAIGDTADITLECARSRAKVPLAARLHGEETEVADRIPFETVAEEVFQRYKRHWKPCTLKVNLGYYRNQILALVQGQGDCRHRANRRPEMVCLAP